MKKGLVYFLLMHLICTNVSAQAGIDLFDDSYTHDIRINFENSNFYQTMIELYGEAHAMDENADYIRASITIDGNIESPNGNSLDTIGVRMKGDFSFVLTGDKKPFKIDINEFVSGQKYDGLKKFNLAPAAGDPSFLREKLGYELLDNLEVIAPRCSYSRVFLNDEYWGLYQIIEQVDKTFLEDRFGNKDGNLFKSNGGASLQWVDDNQSSYADIEFPRYSLKTNKTENNWSDFIAFMKLIDNTSDEDFKSMISANFNVNSFLKDLAVQNYIMNNDNYFHGGNNFYLYHNTLDQRWEWIPWDLNYSMTDYSSFNSEYQKPNDLPAIESSMEDEFSILTRRILNVDEFRSQYLLEVCNLVNTVGSISTMHERIDELSESIREDVMIDTKKTYSNSDFESNIAFGSVQELFIGGLYGVKDFAEQRVTKLTSELINLEVTECSETTAIENNLNRNANLTLSPNPASDALTLNNESGEVLEIEDVQIFNALGQLIFSKEGVRRELILSEVSVGTYFIKLRLVNGLIHHDKFVKQ